MSTLKISDLESLKFSKSAVADNAFDEAFDRAEELISAISPLKADPNLERRTHRLREELVVHADQISSIVEGMGSVEPDLVLSQGHDDPAQVSNQIAALFRFDENGALFTKVFLVDGTDCTAVPHGPFIETCFTPGLRGEECEATCRILASGASRTKAGRMIYVFRATQLTGFKEAANPMEEFTKPPGVFWSVRGEPPELAEQAYSTDVDRDSSSSRVRPQSRSTRA